MINVIDLVLGIFLGLYLFKNTGGVGKTAKSLLITALILMAFGLLAQLVISWDWTEPIQPVVEESLLFKTSHGLIRLVYPTVEKTAPQVDSFIKDKIMDKEETPTAPVQGGPTIMIPKDKLPKLDTKYLPKFGD